MMGIIKLSGQDKLESALKDWQNGEILKAHEQVLKFIVESPENKKAKHLLMKSWFVQGYYKEALQTFTEIDKEYKKYNNCIDLAILANIHLQDYENAFQNKVSMCIFDLVYPYFSPFRQSLRRRLAKLAGTRLQRHIKGYRLGPVKNQRWRRTSLESLDWDRLFIGSRK